MMDVRCHLFGLWWLRLCESERLCELGVEHPRRKKSGQSPVLEPLRNDRIACLRFRRVRERMRIHRRAPDVMPGSG
jgi:hypothetical protein